MLSITISLYAWIFSVFHPFHISVTEVLYRPSEKTIQVSVRIFLDDLELGLRAETGDTKLDIKSSPESDLNTHIGNYVKNRLKLTAKKPISLEYLGFEYEEDALWCYFEAEKVKKFDALQIENKILIEAFSDQENLIHFRSEGKVKSVRLSANDFVATVNRLEM